MQHTGPEKGLKESQNVDEECANIEHCMRDPSNSIKTLDTEEHHVGIEAVWSYNMLWCLLRCGL